jgi:hypothetical protein
MPAGVDFAYFRDVEDTSERGGKTAIGTRYQYTLELILESHSLPCGSASPITGASVGYWATWSLVTIDAEAALTGSTRLSTKLGAFDFDIVPDTTNARSAGSSSKRIKKIWGVDLDLSGSITGGGMHTRLHAITDILDHYAGNYKVFYSDGSAHVIELALGASGTYLKSQGPSSVPTFDTPAGGAHTVPSSGGVHTGSGLTTGYALRVTGAATFDWAQLQHADLGGVSADQHHARSHALNSASDHSGDIDYTQCDAIVNTSGGGSATKITRSDHTHTAADGTSRVPIGSVTEDKVAATDATERTTTSTSYTEDANLSLSLTCAVGDIVIILISGDFYGASTGATYYFRPKISSGTVTTLARSDANTVAIDTATGGHRVLFIAYRCTSAGSIVVRMEYYTSSASYAAKMKNRQAVAFKVGYTAS